MNRRSFLLSLAAPLSAQTRPKVLVIGDSISIGYTPIVQVALASMAEVVRIEGNGADSANVRAKLDDWLSGTDYDLVSLNCGLHDLKYTDRHQVESAAYQQNLEAIFNTMAGRGVRVLWVTTTPIHDERHAGRKAGFSRVNKDVELYNEMALGIVRRRKIQVCDLYRVVQSRGMETLLLKDGTHYTPAGYQILADEVAGAIARELKRIK